MQLSNCNQQHSRHLCLSLAACRLTRGLRPAAANCPGRACCGAHCSRLATALWPATTMGELLPERLAVTGRLAASRHWPSRDAACMLCRWPRDGSMR
jgi:hypothetical protein